MSETTKQKQVEERRRELAAFLRDKGFEAEAARIEAVTPEEEAAFDEWLEDDDNRRRWEAAVKRGSA